MKGKKIWIALFLVFTAHLMAATRAGEVISAQGDVKAVAQNLAAKALSRGSAVYVGDTIQVASSSCCQIRLTDETLLTLTAGTEYRIQSFSTGASPGFTSHVAIGAMRMISGKIAETDPDNVSVTTPSAVIGLRGTVLLVRVLCEGEYMGCESGMISVCNQAGEILLSPSLPNQFAFVSSPESSPQGLSGRPSPLAPLFFAPPKGGGCQ